MALTQTYYRMEITFEQQYLEDLFYTGKSNDKKHRFQPDIVKRYVRCVVLLKEIPDVDVLYERIGLHYELLRGDKAGISSIRVNDRYRLEFRVKDIGVVEDAHVVLCNILELSNHYK